MNRRRLQSVLVSAFLLTTTNLSSAGGTNDSDSQAAKENTPPQWILEAYAKKATVLAAVSVKPSEFRFEETDLDGDGHHDWVIYSSLFCGSAGCRADVYQFVGNGYCYVGWTRYGDAPDVLRNKYPDLKCEMKDKQLKEPI